MSEVVTTYTDYPIRSPHFFIDYLQNEINKRDLDGLTGGRIQAIKVSGKHPLVQLTGAFLANEGNTTDVAGFLPAISVMEGSESEDNVTLGGGARADAAITQSFLDTIKTSMPNMDDRNNEGQLTDKQIGFIETALARNNGRLRAEVTQNWFRDSVMISLWTHNIEERQVLGTTLRSVVNGLRRVLAKRRVRDVSFTTDKGLVNMNFGRILEGQESEVAFLNWFKTVVIFDEEAKAQVANIEEINVKVHAMYKPVSNGTARSPDGVEIWEAENP